MTQNFQIDVRFNLKTFLGSLLLKIFYGLNRRIVKGRKNYLNLTKNGEPVIIAVWHGHLLSVFHDLRDLKVNALAGTHNDAEEISRIASAWGWTMIRGSSKEKGSLAYKAILRVLKKPGSIFFITPDGPTGPRRIPKPGLIRAAQMTGASIIPVSVHSTRNWQFRNWDIFHLEKPFGKIFINYGKPIKYDKNEKREDCINKFIQAMELTEKNNLYYASKK
tara:strand:- start:487 stop:1146 length:660 start_codon:yes stop_codon:yes gene_type:complete